MSLEISKLQLYSKKFIKTINAFVVSFLYLILHMPANQPWKWRPENDKQKMFQHLLEAFEGELSFFYIANNRNRRFPHLFQSICGMESSKQQLQWVTYGWSFQFLSHQFYSRLRIMIKTNTMCLGSMFGCCFWKTKPESTKLSQCGKPTAHVILSIFSFQSNNILFPDRDWQYIWIQEPNLFFRLSGSNLVMHFSVLFTVQKYTKSALKPKCSWLLSSYT